MIQAGKTLGLTVGIVVDRDDKDEKLGRVKVKLPMESDRVTDWCRVLMPYGGAQHGAYIVPEIDDEVVLGYYVGDPKILFVLGSIYSAKRKPPTDKIDERKLKTKGGYVAIFSDVDGEQHFEISAPEGQKIRAVKKTKTLVIQNDHLIEMAGDAKKVLIKSKGGSQVLLDDGGKKVVVQTPGGHFVMINDASGEISVKATKVTVTASSIDLVQG